MNRNIETVLKELRVLQERGEQYWNIAEPSAVFLNMLVRILNAQNVLEVGTSNGWSGLYLCDALVDTKGKLYTIESHKARFEFAEQNFKKADVSDIVTQIKGHAPEAAIEFFGNDKPIFDLILLDATKEETISYVEAFKPFCRKGTVIIVDNVNSHKEALAKFLQYIKEREDIKSMKLDIGAGLLFAVF